ncbi:hypothetical protein [Phenylobacterium sp.]|uniref:hypothetical protein n=1 Tax=Phenylobacterium sp. TaxID=1871053 RepID=UPI0027300D62|nr:hypothetical protein [Phenylobacterium sp.]MDP2213491.1 hypothetical protein [Phenylobacterium sp.]
MAALLIIVALPKMGAMVGTVPLYVSVVVGQLLAMVGIYHALKHLRHWREALLVILLSVLTFIWLGHFLFALGQGLLAREVARYVFYFLPFTGLAVCLAVSSSKCSTGQIVFTVRNACYAIMGYACLQIVFGPELLAIQYVTAVYGDSFDEVITKTNVIHRLGGELSKVFSTYQNGNLFAVALTILFPVAFFSEKRRSIRLIAFVAAHVIFVFAASTTGYISIILIDGFIIWRMARGGRSSLMALMLFLASVSSVVAMLVFFTDFGVVGDLLSAKLFQRDLSENLRWYKSSLWMQSIAERPVGFFFGEMSRRDMIPVFEVLPFSIAQFYGIPVAILFYVVIISYLLPLRVSDFNIGLLAYLITSVGSSGFWLTPTPYIIGIALGIVQRERLDREVLGPTRWGSSPSLPSASEGPRGAVAFS